MATIVIHGARQLLTLRGGAGPRRGREMNELHVIPDGSLLIRDGVLAEVGPARRIENLADARNAVEIDASRRVVMPAFVDSHTHLLFPPPGMDSDLSAEHAIRTTSGHRLQSRARYWLEAMARHGTVTLEAKTGCGSESSDAKLLRAYAALNGSPLKLIPTYLFQVPRDLQAAETAIAETLPKFRRRRAARFADVFWEPENERADYCRRFLLAAHSLGFQRKVHANGAGLAAAIEAGREHQAASIDHPEHASAEEVRLLAGSPAIVTLLPSATLRDGAPVAPARALVDAGAAVAIASDFSPHPECAINMQSAVALACLKLGLTPAEAITAATINGAHALGCAARTGSLEPGKSADLLLLNVADYRELARNFGTNLVHMTFKAGECIYREGKVVSAC